MAESNSNPEELQEENASAVETTEVGQDQEQSEGTGQEQSDTDTEHSGTEAEEGQSTDEQAEEGEEDTFFDPNQVPEELKPAYKQMQAAFTKKTQALAEKRQELERQSEKPPEEQFREEGQQTKPEQASTDDIRAEVLKELNIDESKLDDRTRQVLNLMITAAEKVSNRAVGKAVQPLYQKSTQQELQDFFTNTPEARQYAKAMAAIDKRTGERLTLDELFVLASRQDRDGKVKDERSSNAEQRRRQNAESASGSSAHGAAPSNNPIDDLFQAAQERDKWMP